MSAASVLLGRRSSTAAPVDQAPTIVRLTLRRGTARTGLALVSAIVVFVVVVPLLSSRDPYADDGIQLQAPSAAHLLGTDQMGRDLLIRLAAGGWRSLGGAVLALTLAMAAGIAIGAVAAVVGRRVNTVVTRTVDALNGIPPLVLPIALVGALGPGYPNLLLAIVLSYLPSYIRIARSYADRLSTRLDLVSARLLGISTVRIIATHAVPAVFTQMLVVGTLDLGGVVVALSSLSFLGLGAQAPTPEWGVLLADGQLYFAAAPWLLVAPAAVITVLILGTSLLGEALRDSVAEQAGR